MVFSLTSCVTTVHAQDDAYLDTEIDASVIVAMGTAHIVNDMIEYYFYDGWYYYPHWINDYYYFDRYRRPLPPRAFHDWYRPIPRHYGYKPVPPRHNNRYAKPIPRRHNPYHRREIYRNRDSRPVPHITRPHTNMGGGHHGNMDGRPSGGHRSSTRMGGKR